MSDEAAYRAHHGLNQSFLKSLIAGKFRNYEDDPMKRIRKGNALVIGSAVDCLVTDPMSWVSYYVIESTIPTKQDRNIIETALDIMNSKQLLNLCLMPPDDVIEEAYNTVGVGNRKLETIIKKFQEDGPYFEIYRELAENYDKNWIAREDFELVNELSCNVINHPYTRQVFKNNREQIFQKAIYFDHEGIDCKALLDILQIDHDEKVIYMYDLKTTREYPHAFRNAIEDNRYDIQARWYEYAVRSEYHGLILAGYTLAPFTFLVASKKDPSVPVQVPLNFINGNKIDEEIRELIKRYKFYEEHGYDVDMEIVRNEGILPVFKD